MLINDKTIPGLDPDKLFTDGLVYLQTSQWLLAYTVFAQLYGSKKDKSVSLLYNMALCHIFTKEYPKAIAVLEEDIQLELQNWPEVIRLCSLPEMEKCKNVIAALTKAKTNINTSKA